MYPDNYDVDGHADDSEYYDRNPYRRYPDKKHIYKATEEAGEAPL